MLILRIWAQQPGKFFFLSSKDGTGRWRDHVFKRSELRRGVPAFIKQYKDRDIYFCPHGFSQPQRLKPYAMMPRLLWSDMDEADPRKIKLKPTIAIESSPGRFVGLWVIDQPTTEEHNRRLAYMIGADKSGWDLTQVLRVPGTVNYKYSATPKVRILWSDGPEYKLKRIERELPEDEEVGSNAGNESDAAAIFKKYQKKLPMWCRRELLNGKPKTGKRSEMIWKLEQTIIESGVSTEDAFVLIKASPWNKFAGRRNEDEQLRRELEKAVNHHFKASKKIVGEDDDDDAPTIMFRSMDEVEEENLEWIHYPYLARGELSILEGDPGLGKSYLAQMIATAICDGDKLPSVKMNKPVEGRVIYFDIENSAGSVTKKRLTTNGLENLRNFIQCEEPFSIDDEDVVEKIYEYMEKHRPTLVVFDTLNTYIGKADAFKGHEAQQAFVKFKSLAKRFHCAVLVLRHLTKGKMERALYRGQGSISFAGLARVVMTVGCVPDDPDTRVMAVTKINVTKPPKALTFNIDALPDTIKEKDRSKFRWGEFVDLSSDDIIGSPPKTNNNEREDAKTFLKDALESGEVTSTKIAKMAEARSISPRTLQRAADDLQIKKRTEGFGKKKKSYWSLG